MFTKLTDKLDLFLQLGTPGNDCVVYHKGACVYRRYAGYADRERKIPMTGNERYNIYSCTKVVTCVAALKLLESGAFRLEDRLCDYMPEFSHMTVRDSTGIRAAERPILIEHLFTMMAGFSYDLHSPALEAFRKETGGVCATRDFARYLAREPLLFEPGTRWEYGLSHDVLGALIEVLSGQTFGAYVKQQIFDPLGMTRSTLLPDASDVDSLCAQYDYNAAEARTVRISGENRYRFGTAFESGGAGCVSTVEDYIRFLEGLRTGKLLKPETIALMTKNRMSEAQAVHYWVGKDYGYGLGVRCSNARETFYDYGWGGAAGAYLMIDPTHEISVFYAQHVLTSPIREMRPQIRDVVNQILIEDAPCATKS